MLIIPSKSNPYDQNKTNINFKQNLYKWINLYLIAIYFILKIQKKMLCYSLPKGFKPRK